MQPRTLYTRLIPALAVVLLIGFAALGYLFWRSHTSLTAKLEEARNTHAGEKAELESQVDRLTEALTATQEEREQLAAELQAEEQKNEQFEEQIKDISGTVGTLDKLARTDEELLQKYSKVYFLNEHFVPPKLERIEDEYVYTESKEHYLDSRVIPHLEEMADDAKDDGVDLWVVSAYRSFGEQSELKARYRITYGEGANTFSADQGYSEHQLGTTIDLTTSGIGGGLSGFGDTAAYQWLLDNAYKYGFILSYPKNNGYYVFEPWHWRFVGEDLAEYLHDEDLHFYDVSQRTLDEYLVSIFD